MVGSVGLQAMSQTSGNWGSSRMCATMRFVFTCQARMPFPTVPTSLQAVHPASHAIAIRVGSTSAHRAAPVALTSGMEWETSLYQTHRSSIGRKGVKA